MAIAFVAAAAGTADGDGGTSVTQSYTVTTEDCIFAGTFFQLASGTVSAATYNSETMLSGNGAKLFDGGNDGGTTNRIAGLILLNPDTGTHDLVITYSTSASGMQTGIVGLTGVHQTIGSAYRTVPTITSGGGSTQPSITVTASASGDLCIDVCVVSAATITVDASQSSRVEVDDIFGSSTSWGISTESASGASTVMSWTGNTTNSIGAAALVPASLNVSAALTGTATASINEGDIVTGGKTVILTLTDETYVAAAGTPTYNAATTKGTTAADSAGGGGGRDGDGALSCTFPSGYTPTAGHFALMIVYSDGGSGSVPTDWSQVTGSPWGSSTPKLQAFYKVLVGGESAPSTTISGSASLNSHCANMVIYTGVGSIGAVGTATAGTGATMSAAAITTTANNSIAVFACGRGDNESASGQTFGGSSTGVNERLDGGTAAGNDSQVSMADLAIATSGTSSGAGASTTSATDPFVGVIFELKPSTPFADARAAIRNGLDSAQSEAAGWDAKVKGNIPVANVVRTSNTVCTITLQAQADYNITATETITATLPASALAGGAPIVATPTFTVASSGGTSISAPAFSHTYTPKATQVRARVGTAQVTHTYTSQAPKIHVKVAPDVRAHTYTARAPNTTIGAMVAATVSHTYVPRTAQARSGIVPAQIIHTYTARATKVNASVMPLKALHTFDPRAVQVRARVAVPSRSHVYTARQPGISGSSNIPSVDHVYTMRPVKVQLHAFYGETFHAYTPIAPKANASVMPAARTHTYLGRDVGLRAKINPPNNVHAYVVRVPQAKRSVGTPSAIHTYSSVQPSTLAGNAMAVPTSLHVYVARAGELRAKVQTVQTTHAYAPHAPGTQAVIVPVHITHSYTGIAPDMIAGTILHPDRVTHIYTCRLPQPGTQNVRVIPGHPLGRGRR